jgi:YidC/Oxa1 family membrane protein insertase
VQTDKIEAPNNLWKHSRQNYDVIFVNSQAAVQEVVFKQYKSSVLKLKNGFLIQGPDLIFSKTNSFSDDYCIFLHQDEDKRILKKFIFHNSKYTIDLELTIENLSRTSIDVSLPLVLGALNFSIDPNEARFQDVAFQSNGRLLRPNPHKDCTIENVQFLGLRNRYFCAIIQPTNKDNFSGWVKRVNPQESELGLKGRDIKLMPGGRAEEKFCIYLGPQDLQLITQVNPEWSTIMYYGTFSVISQFLLQSLEFINRFVHNWGLAIIVLSLIIYIILFPLSLKQMRSMKEMQALQPTIEELRKTYKDNPQKLNKEIMELYREHKVNPLGGCLPLILQIPIFFALYQALIRSIFLKGASFLWIKDLSEPDKLFKINLTGKTLDINILPILMALEMFIQQKISTTATGTGTSEQQRLMLILFPIMFGFIFYSMPSGLVLYWFINSTLMLIYQFRTNIKK